ncbi:MAG: DUF934 domain-containing protein [Reyranellaceae bacterium]
MPLLRNGRVAEDAWLPVADDAPLPADGAIVISFARFKAEPDRLFGRNAALGLRLKNTDDVRALADHVGRLGLIALEFPKYTDGRAYSQARILREELRYAGELRAVGNVLLDQLLFMQRCGFDAFELARPDAELAWRKAVAAFTVFHQPTGDGRATILELRRRALFEQRATATWSGTAG